MDDGADFLWGLIIGLAVGIFFEKFARARRDVRAAKAGVTLTRRVLWRFATPRFVLFGFLGVCAAIAAIRLATGTAG